MSEVSITSLAENTDVLIIGAGAAGLMCSFRAGQRERRVVVLDHANKVGKKILGPADDQVLVCIAVNIADVESSLLK